MAVSRQRTNASESRGTLIILSFTRRAATHGLPHKQRKKEFFSLRNAEEKRNMPWPRLKKPMKQEYHSLKVHCPSSRKLRTACCLTIYAARPRYSKTAISQNHDFIWTSCRNVCERAVLKQTAFKSHLWGLKATNSVNQRPEHCSGSHNRPEINAIYSFPEDLKACKKDLEKKTFLI